MAYLTFRFDVDAALADAWSDALIDAGALSEMVVEGIKTNIPLHQELLQDDKFLRGGTSIHYLEEKLAKR